MHLRLVDAAGEVELALRDDLGEDRQHRCGGDHRRADPHSSPGSRDRLRDPGRERLAVPRREPRAHLSLADADGVRRNASTQLDGTRLPQLGEVLFEPRCDRRRADDRDDVLLAGERVVGPVHRAGPDGVAVADDVLVVHQVRDAGDRPGRNVERRDQRGVGLRGRWNRDRVPMVDVVEEANCDAARVRRPDRLPDERGVFRAEVQVVVGEVERPLRPADELLDPGEDARRRLAAVGQSTNLEHGVVVRQSACVCPDRRNVQPVRGLAAASAKARRLPGPRERARRSSSSARRRATTARGSRASRSPRNDS